MILDFCLISGLLWGVLPPEEDHACEQLAGVSIFGDDVASLTYHYGDDDEDVEVELNRDEESGESEESYEDEEEEEGSVIVLCNGGCLDLTDCRHDKGKHHVVSVGFENMSVTRQYLEYLKCFPELEDLSFLDCEFEKDLKIPFDHWPKLTDFNWSSSAEQETPIPDWLLKQVALSKSIARISGDISPKDIPLVTGMKSLRSFRLEICDETSLRALLPLRDQLLELYLSGKCPENLAETLSQFHALRILHIYDMPVDDAFVGSIQKMDLAILWLIKTDVTDGCIPTIKNWKTLHDVCISSLKREDCQITPEGEQELLQTPGKDIWVHEVPFARGWENLSDEELKQEFNGSSDKCIPTRKF